MVAESSKEKRLLLVGGGHAQVYVLDSFASRPMPGVRLTLLARDIQTPYSGMLPGFMAGHYARDECYIDLARLAARAGAELVHDEAVGLDRSGQTVLRRDGPPLPYDLVSFDIGSTPSLRGVPGAADFATPVKPVSTLRARWNDILKRTVVEPGGLRFVTVGGGAAGVEVTLAIRHRLRALAKEWDLNPDAYHFSLVTKGDLLQDHNASVRRRFRRILTEHNIDYAEQEPVTGVEKDRVICRSGRSFGFDELVWVTEAGGAPWLSDSGLALDASGFIVVDATLQSVTDPCVFASGDIASNRDYPRPKAGVFAVRQGPVLAENLRRTLAGEEPRPFRPQREFLSIITTGEKYAVASRGLWAVEGRFVWWWKDQIDRRWMRQWQEPPA